MSNDLRTSDGKYTYTVDRPCVCGHGLEFHTAEKPRACGNYGTGLIDCDCRNYRPSRMGGFIISNIIEPGDYISWTYRHHLNGRSVTAVTKTGQYEGLVAHRPGYKGKQLASVWFRGNKWNSTVPFDELVKLRPRIEREVWNPSQDQLV